MRERKRKRCFTENVVPELKSESGAEDLLVLRRTDGSDPNYIPSGSDDSGYDVFTPRTRRRSSAPPPQEQLGTPTPTSQVKRRRVPHLLPRLSSDSSERKKQPKRKAMHRDVSVATVSVKKKEKKERLHSKGEDQVSFMPAASWTPLSLFRLFFSASSVRTIIANTNAKAAKSLEAGLQFSWAPLTDSDFWIFIGIILFTGLVSVHQRSDYWSKEWPHGFAFPRSHMSCKRFETILWSLHLSNPSEDEENNRKKNTAEYDRLFKIKPLYTELVSACQAHFQPCPNICMDEGMMDSKPCVTIKQNMKLSDALIKYESVQHKTMKWYKTFFYHFIDVAVVNSFLLHKELCEKNNQKPHIQRTFRESLTKEMLEFAAASGPPSSPPVTCMPMFYGPEDIEGDDKRKYCKRCFGLGNKRVKTRVYCRRCQVPLCFGKDKNCFMDWHDCLFF